MIRPKGYTRIPDYTPLTWFETLFWKRNCEIEYFKYWSYYNAPRIDHIHFDVDSFRSIWIKNKLHQIVGMDKNTKKLYLVCFLTNEHNKHFYRIESL